MSKIRQRLRLILGLSILFIVGFIAYLRHRFSFRFLSSFIVTIAIVSSFLASNSSQSTLFSTPQNIPSLQVERPRVAYGELQPPYRTTTPSATTTSSTNLDVVATAYGPPWGGIEGKGITYTGIDLTSSPVRYIVAVDPDFIPLGSFLKIWPNPFEYEGKFIAADTGGDIRGARIDFYDWRGRVAQNDWGRKLVHTNISFQ